MELRRYAEIINRRKGIVALVVVIVLMVVAFLTGRTAPTFSASATVRIAQGQDGTISSSELNYAERLMQTYAYLLKSQPYMEEVIERLDLRTRPASLAKRITVQTLAGTELIKITTEDTDPERAANVANTLATLLVEQGLRMYSGQGKSAREILQDQLSAVELQLRDDRAELANLYSVPVDSGTSEGKSRDDLAAKIRVEEQTYMLLLNEYDQARVQEALRANSVSVVEQASAPSAPSKPNVSLNYVLATVFGLVAGLSLVFLIDNLDPTLRSPGELERIAQIPLLGRIPSFAQRRQFSKASVFFCNSALQTPAFEAFRALAAYAWSLSGDRPQKNIVVVSAEPGAGKTTVATNLAAALSQSGRRVILVDGDLRNPSFHAIFGLAPAPGLRELILGACSPHAAEQKTGLPGLSLIASGQLHTAPTDLSNSTSLAKVMAELARMADIVLWDSSPILASADASVLALRADGVLFVAAEGKTVEEHLRIALKQLSQVGVNVWGVIYNRARNDKLSQYYSHYYQRGTLELSTRGRPVVAHLEEAPAGEHSSG